MSNKNIAIIAGSLAKESVNKKFANFLAAHPDFPGNPIFANVDIPLYSADYDAIENNPGAPLKKIVDEAAAVIIVTPEYNHSFTAVTKNATDWLSRPWGKNSLDGKRVLVASASPSPNNGKFATADLYDVLEFMNADIVDTILNIHISEDTYTEIDGRLELSSEHDRASLKAAFEGLAK